MLTGFRPDTKIVGLNAVPPRDRPPATIVHLAFDVMVGAATRAVAARGLVPVRLVAAARPAALALVLSRRGRRRAAVDARDGGGVDHDRGRPPALGRLRPPAHLRGGHARARDLGHRSPPSSRSTPPSARASSSSCARWPGAGAHRVPEPLPGPYAPRGPLVSFRRARACRLLRTRHPKEGRQHEHHRRRDPVVWRHLLRRLRRRRLRRGVLGSDRRGREARRPAARADRPGDVTRLGGEQRLADLRAGRVVDGVSARLRRRHVGAVRAAEPRRRRHRAARRRVRVPQDGPGAGRAAAPRRDVRAVVGGDAVLPRRRAGRHRVGAGARRRSGRRSGHRRGPARRRC